MFSHWPTRIWSPLVWSIFEGLRLNQRELLAAAAEQFCGSVDANRLMRSIADVGAERFSRVMEGLIHADGGEDLEKELGSYGERCDDGDETTEKWEEGLHEKIEEAEANGLFLCHEEKLETMVRQHNNTLLVSYNEGLHARVIPFKLHVELGAHQVRSKPCRYSSQKLQSLRIYVT